jgi:hypothetical protein
MEEARPLVENAFAHERRVLNGSKPCPWRSGHACHVAEKGALSWTPSRMPALPAG